MALRCSGQRYSSLEVPLGKRDLLQSQISMKQFLLVVAGAVAGGALGYFAFGWLLAQGYYGLVLPGGLLGIGAGIGRNRWLSLAIVCGVAALVLGLFTQWHFFFLDGQSSLGYFVTHLHHLSLTTLLMLAVGTAIGFWVPFRRIEKPK